MIRLIVAIPSLFLIANSPNSPLSPTPVDNRPIRPLDEPADKIGAPVLKENDLSRLKKIDEQMNSLRGYFNNAGNEPSADMRTAWNDIQKKRDALTRGQTNLHRAAAVGEKDFHKQLAEIEVQLKGLENQTRIQPSTRTN